MSEKTFEEMMRDANLPALPDPYAAPTQAKIIELSDAVLTALEGEPLSPWQKQCVLGTALMRTLTGVANLQERAAMATFGVEQFCDRVMILVKLCEQGLGGPDMSLPGTMHVPTVDDVGHA